jgi:hypothetical protein
MTNAAGSAFETRKKPFIVPKEEGVKNAMQSFLEKPEIT